MGIGLQGVMGPRGWGGVIVGDLFDMTELSEIKDNNIKFVIL